MASKRRSLAEIAREDAGDKPTPVPPLRPAPVPPPRVETSAPPVAPESKSEIRNRKSDFIKMSVTVPPGMFEALQQVSITRRRDKRPYTMSDLVREAVAARLPQG